VFSGTMRVFPETGMSISEPCVFFQKQACPFRNHACFSRNRHVHFGTMRVFPETGMSISEPGVFFQKQACLFLNQACFSRNWPVFSGRRALSPERCCPPLFKATAGNMAP